MSDKTLKIGEVTEETIEAIKKRSAFALPDNPSASGMKATEIKKAFWAPIISQYGSLFTELARVIKEANASLDALDEEDKRIAEDLLEKFSLAQSNLQTALEALEAHDSSDAAHADIRKWLREVEALTETIKTWQNEGSDLPPAFSLVKSFYEAFLDAKNELMPMASGSINNIKYDADAGDLILYFNNGASVKVELPLERLVGEGYYDEESRTIRLSLDGGDELVIPVGDLVDEYEGDGETVEVYREGGVRKIRILPAFIKKNEQRITDIEDRVSGQYVLLEEITTEEELTEYNYRPVNNGRNPLKAAYVRMELAAHSAASSSVGQVNIYFYGVNDWTSCCSASSTIYNRVRVVSVQTINEYGKWRAIKTEADNRFNATVVQMCPAKAIYDCNITRIRLEALTEGIAIPVGTKISVWGVEI